MIAQRILAIRSQELHQLAALDVGETGAHTHMLQRPVGVVETEQ